ATVLDPNLIVDHHERHELATVLHDRAVIGGLDRFWIDLLEPGHQRQRNRLWMWRSGAEQKHGFEQAVVGGPLGVGFHKQALRPRTRHFLGDPVRIDNQDHRTVAQNRIAAKHRYMPQHSRHGLYDDLFGVKHGIDDDTEAMVADLRNNDEAVLDFIHRAFADLQKRVEMDQRQQLVAQPQHGGVLDPLDAMFAVAAHTH